MQDKNKKSPKETIIDNYLNLVGMAESSNNPNAKNKNSSATGLYQFTDATWKDIQKKIGKKLDILNPEDQKQALKKLTEINVSALEKNNLPITEANLYTTHFLGTTGGPRFLKNLQANPNELATKYVNDSTAKANKELFYNNDNPVSAAELFNTLSRKVAPKNQIQQTVQSDNFVPKQEFNETVIESTGTQEPQVPLQRNIRGSKTLSQNERQLSPNNNFDTSNPIESSRQQLGLSGALDFLPKDINLAFSEEEQLKEDLEDPNSESQDINIAKNGGFQLGNPNKPMTPEEERRSIGIQKPITKIQKVSTTEDKSNGDLPPGDYYKVYYTNPNRAKIENEDFEYVDSSGYKDLQRRNNFRLYQENLNKQSQPEMKIGNSFANSFEYGGEQNKNTENTLTEGLLNEFNEGESHEENKYGGIPQGLGSNNKLNTVEEGETKFNNYVFSDTLKINQSDIDSLFLPKEIKPGVTYAEASKEINKYLKDNPNDRILKKTVQKQLDALTLGNEKARLAKEELDINLNNNITNENTSDLEVEDANQMFLGGETEGLDMFNSELAKGGISALSGFASGDDKSGQEGLKSLAKTGLSMGANALLPGSGMFVSPVFDAVDGLLSGNKEEEEMRRNNAIKRSLGYNNDFRYGGPNGEQNTPPYDNYDLEQGTINSNDLTNKLSNKYNSFPESIISIPDNELNNETSLTGFNTESNFEDISKPNNFQAKGKSPLQYAPVLGDFLNFMDAKNDKPEVENLNKLSQRFNPDYADEAYAQNLITNDFDNTINSLANSSNGSAATLRANILGANANRAKAQSEAYFNMDNINRQQDAKGQQFNLNIDQANIGQDNLQRDINARNRAAVEDRKRMSRDSLFKDIGAIGKEQTYDNRLFNLTGGYNSQGKYNPENTDFISTFAEQLGLAKRKQSEYDTEDDTNENALGGVLGKVLNYTDEYKKRKQITDSFNNKYR